MSNTNDLDNLNNNINNDINSLAIQNNRVADMHTQTEELISISVFQRRGEISISSHLPNISSIESTFNINNGFVIRQTLVNNSENDTNSSNTINNAVVNTNINNNNITIDTNDLNSIEDRVLEENRTAQESLNQLGNNIEQHSEINVNIRNDISDYVAAESRGLFNRIFDSISLFSPYTIISTAGIVLLGTYIGSYLIRNLNRTDVETVSNSNDSSNNNLQDTSFSFNLFGFNYRNRNISNNNSDTNNNGFFRGLFNSLFNFGSTNNLNTNINNTSTNTNTSTTIFAKIKKIIPLFKKK